MKIISLTAENVKKIRAVSISPSGPLVQITGANGSGKSSVLDSIFYALAGGRSLPAEPIRQGEQSARIRLDMGEIVVTRRFTPSGSTLTVEGVNGAKFSSPQKLLDEMAGSISFDPLEFTRLDARSQYDMLRRLVPLDTDVDALDEANRLDFEARTEVGREIKNLQAQIDPALIPPGLPDARIDVDALMKRMSDAAARNAQIQTQRAGRTQTEQRIAADRKRAADLEAETGKEIERVGKQLETDIDYCQKQIQVLQARIETLKTEHAARMEKLTSERAKEILDLRAGADRMALDLGDDTAAPVLEDVEAIRQEIANANLVNAGIVAREGQEITQKRVAEKEAEAAGLTARMDERKAAKAAAIERAVMPIGGLSFGDGVVLYNRVPFAQASSAEQLRVSVAIAMAGNPKLRVLRIKEGSLLDEHSLEMIRNMATDGDYQVWIEQVDTTGKVGIVMEDGLAHQAVAS